jgi:hypothetical protein
LENISWWTYFSCRCWNRFLNWDKRPCVSSVINSGCIRCWICNRSNCSA